MTLDCGHEFENQGRCGKCNRCYICCCKCEAARATEMKAAQQQPRLPRRLPQPDSNYAQVLSRDDAVGRSRVEIMCSCGFLSWHYLWSWAGHGKTRCPNCNKWICYRTCGVFATVEELRAILKVAIK